MDLLLCWKAEHGVISNQLSWRLDTFRSSIPRLTSKERPHGAGCPQHMTHPAHSKLSVVTDSGNCSIPKQGAEQTWLRWKGTIGTTFCIWGGNANLFNGSYVRGSIGSTSWMLASLVSKRTFPRSWRWRVFYLSVCSCLRTLRLREHGDFSKVNRAMMGQTGFNSHREASGPCLFLLLYAFCYF